MPDREQLFADIDTMQPERFTAHLAENVTMRFGNADPVHGRAAVGQAWGDFCAGIAGVAHALRNRWTVGDTTIVEADVTYTRRDGGRVTVPVATIYHEGPAGIDDYRIYIDLAPLFAGAPEG